jgi:tetratricopeptide (TPR) repeat protein
MNSFLVGGRLDLAPAYAEAILRLGRQLRSQELVTYGWRYYASAAFHAGNLPLAEKYHRRMVKHADRFGDSRMSFVAALTDGVILGRHGDYAGSIERLWEAFTLADFDWIRGQAMANLGETLYRIGHFRAARAARSAALRMTPARYALLVNLGGYAVCSAALGDARGVQWAVSRTRSLVGKENQLGMAQGLLGCADACAMVGLDGLARELYDDGIKRAIAGGYHDWAFRPNPVVNRPLPPGAQRLIGQAEKASQKVTDLAPEGVADDLELTVV